MTARGRWWWGLLAGLSLCLAAACTIPPGRVEAGSPMPPFAAATLTGETLSLAQLRGEVVLLNVWATWCYPCRQEMPSLEALHRELAPDGLRVVGVSVDRAGARGTIRGFLDDYGITFTILHDPAHEVGRAFGTIGLPETYLIDRRGRLVRHWIGLIDGRSPAVRGPVLEALGRSGSVGRAGAVAGGERS